MTDVSWPFDPVEFVTALELREATQGASDVEVRRAIEAAEGDA